MLHWLLNAFNVYLMHPMRGDGYQWWSGPGSDLSEISIPAAALGFYWHHTCHVGPCWRYGRHQVEGTPYKVCRKHHPSVPDTITPEHIAEAYADAQALAGGAGPETSNLGG